VFRIIFFLLIVLGLGFLFAWIADNPGMIFIQWEWLAAQMGRPGDEIGVPLTLALATLVALIVSVMFIAGLLKGIFGMPSLLSRFFENRKRERGYKALSQGLIAASSGDADTARSLAKESGRLLGKDPLVALLGTQTALLEGKRDEATANFKTMLADDNTRMVALRGLFLEAERQGEAEAARHYAEEAAREAPSLPWAGGAKLRYQASDGDWDAAIQTLEANRSAGLIDKETAKRRRAVLLTAKAISVEQANPDSAKKLAKEAHKLAKDLVPAATTFARAASRLGDIGGASKILEATWKLSPHPELAEAYSSVRAGDSVLDRLKRARKLAKLKTNHVEGNLAVAIAAIDAKEWDDARAALEPVLTSRPTERACLLMADIEEGQHGDQGRMRDWLARAVRAPADEAWTADGHVSEEWLPLSPMTGEVDAFEWKVPVAQLGDEDIPVLTVEELKAEATPIVATVATAEVAEVVELDNVSDAEVVESDHQEPEENVEKDAAEQSEEMIEAPASPVLTETDEPVEPDTNDNVIELDAAKQKIEEASEASFEEVQETVEATSDEVEFPLGRRPDDPGPHPDKEPHKKGFKLF